MFPQAGQIVGNHINWLFGTWDKFFGIDILRVEKKRLRMNNPFTVSPCFESPAQYRSLSGIWNLVWHGICYLVAKSLAMGSVEDIWHCLTSSWDDKLFWLNTYWPPRDDRNFFRERSMHLYGCNQHPLTNSPIDILPRRLSSREFQSLSPLLIHTCWPYLCFLCDWYLVGR